MTLADPILFERHLLHGNKQVCAANRAGSLCGFSASQSFSDVTSGYGGKFPPDFSNTTSKKYVQSKSESGLLISAAIELMTAF